MTAVTVFTVAMIALFIKTGATPDTLIVSFFGFIGGEAGVLGLIRYSDAKYPGSDGTTSSTDGADAAGTTGTGSDGGVG